MFSLQQILLGKLQLDARSLADDTPLDTWAPLVHGKFHVSITRVQKFFVVLIIQHNFAPYVAQSPPAYLSQSTYTVPPQSLPQQPVPQYIPPTAPPSNPYAYNPYSNPYAIPPQTTTPPPYVQQPILPQPVPQPVQPAIAPPSSMHHTLPPAQPVQTGPPLPPKITLPAEYDKRVVLAVMAQSVQAGIPCVVGLTVQSPRRF